CEGDGGRGGRTTGALLGRTRMRRGRTTRWSAALIGAALSACGGDRVTLHLMLPPGDGGSHGDAGDGGGTGGASASIDGGLGLGGSGSGGASALGGAPGSGGRGTGGANGVGGAPGFGGAVGGCPASPVVTADLHGVYSVGALDVWAVGTVGTILRYDGCWRVETSPTTATLEAVWAAPGGVVAWAVGPGGIAVRRDAGVWSIVPVPTTQSLT